MTLKETLKQELDRLNEDQLQQVANFIAFVEFTAKQDSFPLWQTTTPAQRAAKWRESVAQPGTISPNLPDSALGRDSIYSE
ncbi:hypothetical protein PMG71_05630 [Roseofilum sp. BLCC_M154]|uniref:DUF2281 domain-containing protein n=1 Tax=Roseofilum acuticapitatum BLCC-M154 TaxID=3022444 RepID=A0ABT7APS1_9CYAN|nr:hypothetical protein [Roseofilum acuticapitatum]MDJ1168900.1 hypothetical protein [Roseofilum acuticapitatum BLCC-M154]